jgi:hypothetical protein
MPILDERQTGPKTRLVWGPVLEKAVKTLLFPLNARQLSQKLRFWESLMCIKKKRDKDA